MSPDFPKSFKGDLVTPSNPDYQTSIARWASNAQRNAKLVAFVKDAEDVVLAINYAKASSLPLAIRGGGHSVSGASSCEGGIVIDLSRYLKDVKIDPEAKLAYVGGGAIWETVDKAAIEHGLAIVGGTINHTGVGGLTLGGGFGWLRGSHGLTIDNLTEATVVTASGSILTASATENPDLFWGIRGGGCNFGVITEFVFKLHPQRRTVYAGILVFPPTVLESMAKFLEGRWAKGLDEKEGMIQWLKRAQDGNPAVLATIFYNGSEDEGRAHWKGLLDLGPVVDMTKEIPYEVLNSLANPVQPHGLASYITGTFQTKPRLSVQTALFEKVIQITAERPKMQCTLGLEYFPLKKIYSVPKDATAFNRSPYPSIMVMMRWPEDEGDDMEFARKAVHDLNGIVMEGNDDLPNQEQGASGYAYANYDPSNEKPQLDKEGTAFNQATPKIFGPNYRRLQEVKKKYDPEVVFSKWFVITPA